MNDTPAFGSKTSIMVLQFILPVVLALIAGYGSVKYASGETQTKMLELERRIQENRTDINRTVDNQMSRREMQLYIDQTRADLQDIKTDIRALRAR